MSAKIEYIIWKDAVSVDAWTSESEIIPAAHVIHSVGILVGENKEAVTLAVNHDRDGGNYSCIMHIPKGMIVSRRKIRAKLA